MLVKSLITLALAAFVVASPVADPEAEAEGEPQLESRRAPRCMKVVHNSSQCGHLPADVKWVPAFRGCYWVAHDRCPGDNTWKDVLVRY